MDREELNSFTIHTKNLFYSVSYFLVLRRPVILSFALKLQSVWEIKVWLETTFYCLNIASYVVPFSNSFCRVID